MVFFSLLCLLVYNFLILVLLFIFLSGGTYMCGMLMVLISSCDYFSCLLSVVFVVIDGFSFVGLLVDACALF